MSIADVRAAFILAGAGGLSLHDAAMRHVGEGAHVLHFTGAHRDGTRFDYVSPPFRGDPDQRGREIARELISAHAVSISSNTNPQEDQPMPAPQPIAGLASTLRDHLTQATARADQVARRAKESVSNLHQVLDSAEGTVAQLDAAAADIQAALGLSTNGGPPLDAPKDGAKNDAKHDATPPTG
jgi:hypothetical protein